MANQNVSKRNLQQAMLLNISRLAPETPILERLSPLTLRQLFHEFLFFAFHFACMSIVYQKNPDALTGLELLMVSLGECSRLIWRSELSLTATWNFSYIRLAAQLVTWPMRGVLQSHCMLVLHCLKQRYKYCCAMTWHRSVLQDDFLCEYAFSVQPKNNRSNNVV